MIQTNPLTLETAHRRSRNNREELAANDVCGCFNCVTVFSPREIAAWIDDGKTALCPKCGIDTVLANTPVSPVTEPNFLNAMRAHVSQK